MLSPSALSGLAQRLSILDSEVVAAQRVLLEIGRGHEEVEVIPYREEVVVQSKLILGRLPLR
ncbi:MAG: hypothetical protein V3W37_11350, partial [Candidatus Binatia bacterium]